jgi:hypothetical protein
MVTIAELKKRTQLRAEIVSTLKRSVAPIHKSRFSEEAQAEFDYLASNGVIMSIGKGKFTVIKESGKGR